MARSSQYNWCTIVYFSNTVIDTDVELAVRTHQTVQPLTLEYAVLLKTYQNIYIIKTPHLRNISSILHHFQTHSTLCIKTVTSVINWDTLLSYVVPYW